MGDLRNSLRQRQVQADGGQCWASQDIVVGLDQVCWLLSCSIIVERHVLIRMVFVDSNCRDLGVAKVLQRSILVHVQVRWLQSCPVHFLSSVRISETSLCRKRWCTYCRRYSSCLSNCRDFGSSAAVRGWDWQIEEAYEILVPQAHCLKKSRAIDLRTLVRATCPVAYFGTRRRKTVTLVLGRTEMVERLERLKQLSPCCGCYQEAHYGED